MPIEKDISEAPPAPDLDAPRERENRFRLIQSALSIGPKEITALFDLFGEPTNITPVQSDGEVIFHYPLGDIPVYCTALIRQSERANLRGAAELPEPWAFHAAAEWEFDERLGMVLGHFSLDRVPGSRFNLIVVEGAFGNLPPRLVHENFDLLPESARQAIARKLADENLIPPPEQCAKVRWDEVAKKDSPANEWRTRLVNLQGAGVPEWKERDLFLGHGKIDLSGHTMNNDVDVYDMPADRAVQSLIQNSRRMLGYYLDPLNDSSLPKMNEPLLGIPSVKEWRARYIAEFDRLKSAANWVTIDSSRVRRVQSSARAAPPPNIIGYIDLSTRARAVPQGKAKPTGASSIEKSQPKLQVNDQGMFTCGKGHTSKLGSYGIERYRNGERINLKCDGCDRCVGYAQLDK